MKKQLLLVALVALNFLNAQTELRSSIGQSWNGTSWDNSLGENYEYDANNNLIVKTIYSNNNGTWEELHKLVFTYNSNNRITSEIFQVFDSYTGAYIDISTKTFTYDSNNNLIGILDEDWNGSQVNNDFKFDISYVNGSVYNILQQWWNGSAWRNYARRVYTNDSNNRVIQIVGESWENGAWQLDYKELVTRDVNGLVVSHVYENWNGSAYVEVYHVEYTIDNSGNRVTKTITFEGDTDVTNYTYDNSQLLSAFAHPFADKTGFYYITKSFPHFNKILSSESADGSYRTLYDYNNAITLSANTFETENKFIVYPNPVESELTVKATNAIKTVEIYNVLGLRVKTSNDTTIHVAHLPDGVYTIKATDNNGHESVKKFVKK